MALISTWPDDAQPASGAASQAGGYRPRMSCPCWFCGEPVGPEAVHQVVWTRPAPEPGQATDEAEEAVMRDLLLHPWCVTRFAVLLLRDARAWDALQVELLITGAVDADEGRSGREG